MPKQPKPDFDCPVCGEKVSGGAKSCPECGACEKSGWNDESYLDGVSLPDDPDDFDHVAFTENEFGRGSKQRGLARVWPWVAGVLLLVTLWLIFR